MMEEIYNEWQLQDQDLGNTEPYQFTKSELLDFAKHYCKKQMPIHDVSKRLEMRKQANNVFELTKGFTTEPSDNAMKTALEMAHNVMVLTSDLDGQSFCKCCGHKTNTTDGKCINLNCSTHRL